MDYWCGCLDLCSVNSDVGDPLLSVKDPVSATTFEGAVPAHSHAASGLDALFSKLLGSHRDG